MAAIFPAILDSTQNEKLSREAEIKKGIYLKK